MSSKPVIERAIATSTGVKMPRTRWDRLGREYVALPEAGTQRAIADYLDREVARIDELIQKKLRMDELLAERGTATIERFIWFENGVARATSRLKRIAKRIDVGIAEAATHAYADTGVPLLRSTNIRPNFLDDADLLYIDRWFADRNSSKYVRTNDILTVRTGNVGASAVVPAQLDRCQCFTQLITTLNGTQNAHFICYALNSGPARMHFQLSGWGSAQANISVPLLGAAPVPLLALGTQLDVTAQIERGLAPIDGIRVTLSQEIALLRERRHALISAAVTGKLAVPAAA
jgi:type I restriction enzyme S subunit